VEILVSERKSPAWAVTRKFNLIFERIQLWRISWRKSSNPKALPKLKVYSKPRKHESIELFWLNHNIGSASLTNIKVQILISDAYICVSQIEYSLEYTLTTKRAPSRFRFARTRPSTFKSYGPKGFLKLRICEIVSASSQGLHEKVTRWPRKRAVRIRNIVVAAPILILCFRDVNDALSSQALVGLQASERGMLKFFLTR
jgi:hypothetical protein